ncbi:DUF4920 domain-containing protein [Polaribacter sp. MSW13]|uniref:DUF4920 domain-containing protein n=1 Tax=Polaribacter marinus TaxID=2916838 RepID=A0A9X1VMV1_9FLAO|nr:DUF4920 domain-containing protein [Polaribacter marinus]MCI2228948.1 DUF4920 domain-containing protein [Polaribacter marinus]
MKLVLKFCVITLLIFASCKKEKATTSTEKTKKEVIAFDSFGDKISADKALTSEEMLAKFSTMKIGDTLNVKFASSIKEVCSKKGCWMKLPLDKETETMVRFKDYGFFMPLDSKDREVIVEGKAFVQETSVKELQHYAEDAGKTKEEIAKITEPKKEFAFVANGVLMKK